MADVQTSIDIDAPIEDVWDIATDIGRMGEWVSIHRDLPDGAPEDLSAGTQFRQTLSVAGKGFDVEWTAAEVERPRKLIWEGAGPAGSSAMTTYSLAPQGEGTRFTYVNRFDLPGGKLGQIAGGAVAGQAERETEDSLARLKALVEG